MKNLKKLKLSAISKSSLNEREQSKIFGGNYCAWGDDNQVGNETGGTCSCYCGNGYGYNSELSAWGSFDKHEAS